MDKALSKVCFKARTKVKMASVDGLSLSKNLTGRIASAPYCPAVSIYLNLNIESVSKIREDLHRTVP